jgi:phosphatidylinositol 4-kinase A
MDAHQFMAKSMEEVSPFREILLTEILTALVEVHAAHVDPTQGPNMLLVKYFQTLAAVLPEPRFQGLPTYSDETVTAFRNMWFTCVIHGVHPNNMWVNTHSTVLQKVAANSPLLVLESTTNDFDADLELNPILNRMKEGKHADYNILAEELIRLFPSHQSEIKGFDHLKLVFVGAVALVETLRSQSGRCSLVLDYFDDANLEKSDASGTLKMVVEYSLKTFLDVLRIGSFTPGVIAIGRRELRELLIRCCDPVPTVQSLAQRCCDRLISTYPGLLCYEETTYVLLELLTLLWESCLTQETDLVNSFSYFINYSISQNSSSGRDWLAWGLSYEILRMIENDYSIRIIRVLENGY